MTQTLPTRRSGLSPFYSGGPLSLLRDEMDDLFSRFWPELESNGGVRPEAMPSLDVSETEDELQLMLDAPGMKPDELNIEVTGDVIRISGEHSEKKEEKGRKYHRIERRSGSFERSLRLPCTIDESKINAEYNNGVLTVTMPKTEEAKTHKIRVKG